MSYQRIAESVLNGEWSRHRLSLEYELEAFEHPDFDIPGVMVRTPSGRVMLVVEGEKELVGPIVEKAREQFDALHGTGAKT